MDLQSMCKIFIYRDDLDHLMDKLNNYKLKYHTLSESNTDVNTYICARLIESMTYMWDKICDLQNNILLEKLYSVLNNNEVVVIDKYMYMNGRNGYHNSLCIHTYDTFYPHKDLTMVKLYTNDELIPIYSTYSFSVDDNEYRQRFLMIHRYQIGDMTNNIIKPIIKATTNKPYTWFH